MLAGLPLGAPAVVAASRIRVTHGVQAGDVDGDRAVIWARADRPARMLVRWGTRENLSDARHAPPLHVSAAGDFTGKIELVGLPAGQRIVYEVRMLDLGDLRTLSEPVRGSLVTPPTSDRTVRILWSVDLCGQGWGIDPDFGGYRIFRAMAALEPDLFVFSGDCIYADNPLVERVETEWGVWRNIVTPDKAKVAETLDEFRGNYRYKLLDENMRSFLTRTALIAQWDDHEVRNNWYWERRREDDDRYTEKSAAVLAARAMRAFHEYMPTRITPEEPHRLFRSFRFGPHVEIFRIDMRTYRGPNTQGREREAGPTTAILGRRQLRWLMDALARSDAT
ncbi:Alkaline phosphatase D [bacterium HR39]|nr:Alkaline phosphatase D [bacterium HR39]